MATLAAADALALACRTSVNARRRDASSSRPPLRHSTPSGTALAARSSATTDRCASGTGAARAADDASAPRRPMVASPGPSATLRHVRIQPRPTRAATPSHARPEDLGRPRRPRGARRPDRPRHRPPPRPRGHQPPGVRGPPPARPDGPPPRADDRDGRPLDARRTTARCPSSTSRPPSRSRSWQRNCEEFGIPLYALGSDRQGIVHVIGPELGLTQPGMTIVCGDSHTATHGAFGALAFGIGTSEVEMVLATQTPAPARPEDLRGPRGRPARARRHGQGHHPQPHLPHRRGRRHRPRVRVHAARPSGRSRWRSG